jgi:addiction module HigA family antidote
MGNVTAVYPGAILRDHVLPALRLTVSQAARDLGISRQTLHRILADSAGITPDVAVRLERFCGVSSQFWMRCQYARDLRRAKVQMKAQLARIPVRALPEDVFTSIGAADER